MLCHVVEYTVGLAKDAWSGSVRRAWDVSISVAGALLKLGKTRPFEAVLSKESRGSNGQGCTCFSKSS